MSTNKEPNAGKVEADTSKPSSANGDQKAGDAAIEAPKDNEVKEAQVESVNDKSEKIVVDLTNVKNEPKTDDNIKELKDEIDKLKKQLSDRDSQLASLKTLNAQLRSTIKQYDEIFALLENENFDDDEPKKDNTKPKTYAARTEKVSEPPQKKSKMTNGVVKNEGSKPKKSENDSLTIDLPEEDDYSCSDDDDSGPPDLEPQVMKDGSGLRMSLRHSIDDPTVRVNQPTANLSTRSRSIVTQGLSSNSVQQLASSAERPQRKKKQSRRFMCEFPDCGVVLKNEECRKQHQRNHNRFQKYVCQYRGCGYLYFATQADLEVHMMQHQGAAV